ncbi:MAG TPA: hypothetical protein VGZ29_09650 [Terriglobia bacterium]|nr:hypothetical protein [Terriglobia bacterium]
MSITKSSISKLLLPILASTAFLTLSCDRNSDRIRVEHKVHSAKQDTSIYSSGEMAGRVVLAAGKEGAPVPGASVVVIDTASGKQVLELLQKEPDAPCLKRLSDMQGALMKVAEASANAGRTPPTATADADGYFMLPQVRPGIYMVVAYGRAGDVRAIWEQPAMVDPYQAVVVKLVEPLISCAAEEEKAKQPPPLPIPGMQPIPATVPPVPPPQPTPAVPPPSTNPTPPS